MNHFFRISYSLASATLYSQPDSVTLADCLANLKSAWTGDLNDRISWAEAELRGHAPDVYPDYVNARERAGVSRREAMMNWCDTTLQRLDRFDRGLEAPSDDAGMEGALVSSESAEERSVSNGVLVVPSRANSVEKLLNRKTQRKQPEAREQVNERSFPGESLPSNKVHGRSRKRDSANMQGQLEIKDTWTRLISRLGEKCRTTVLDLQAELERIARKCGKNISTSFITSMCAKGSRMESYLNRFRRNKSEESQLLREMVELELQSSAGSLSNGKGFISKGEFERLKALREQYGESIQKSFIGMHFRKGHFRMEDVGILIGWCTIDGEFKPALLRSITGMQNGKGMPKEGDVEKLKRWCEMDGQLNLKLLRSITGMQSGKGMPKDGDVEKLKRWCEMDGQLSLELLRGITGMQGGKGMPTEQQVKFLKAWRLHAPFSMATEFAPSYFAFPDGNADDLQFGQQGSPFVEGGISEKERMPVDGEALSREVMSRMNEPVVLDHGSPGGLTSLLESPLRPGSLGRPGAGMTAGDVLKTDSDFVFALEPGYPVVDVDPDEHMASERGEIDWDREQYPDWR